MISLQFSRKVTDTKTNLKAGLEASWERFYSPKTVGYIRSVNNKEAWIESAQLGESLRKNYDHLVLVGIGGSAMGSRFFAEYAHQNSISFLDNIDSIETNDILQKIETNQKIAWLFISKSGTTIEVLWTLDLIAQFYSKKNKIFWENTFFITEKTNNTLHELSLEHQRPCLEIPLDVGGRFSVLTPVGLVAASYLGISLEKIQAGAIKALDSKNEILSIAEQYIFSMEKGENITSFWFYNARMRWFGQWLQQLWAESLGKKEDRQGQPAFSFSTPICCFGACDQHSVLQQYLDGPKNKFVSVFRFKNIEKSNHIIENPLFSQTQILKNLDYGDLIKAETLATHQVLVDHHVPTTLIELEELNAESIGYLFMFFQLLVSTMAEYKNINAYNQPAVEFGKKLVRQFLKN